MNNWILLRMFLQRQFFLTMRQQESIHWKCNNFLCKSARCYGGQQTETHYDILNLPKDCSANDIRAAFVRLSKKYHPDVKGANSNPKETAQFVRISEAYRVLSKPKSRHAYDQDLRMFTNLGHRISQSAKAGTTTKVHRPWDIRPDYDPNANENAYYGFDGIQRVSNSKIAGALIFLAVLGAVFGFVTVRHSFTFNRKQLDEKSAEASIYHASVRANAEKYGNEEQLRRMTNRINGLDR